MEAIVGRCDPGIEFTRYSPRLEEPSTTGTMGCELGIATVPETNVELLRRIAEAYNARDGEAFAALCDPQIELHSVFSAVAGAVLRRATQPMLVRLSGR
jgi:hypothetical protein